MQKHIWIDHQTENKRLKKVRRALVTCIFKALNEYLHAGRMSDIIAMVHNVANSQFLPQLERRCLFLCFILQVDASMYQKKSNILLAMTFKCCLSSRLASQRHLNSCHLDVWNTLVQWELNNFQRVYKAALFQDRSEHVMYFH